MHLDQPKSEYPLKSREGERPIWGGKGGLGNTLACRTNTRWMKNKKKRKDYSDCLLVCFLSTAVGMKMFCSFILLYCIVLCFVVLSWSDLFVQFQFFVLCWLSSSFALSVRINKQNETKRIEQCCDNPVLYCLVCFDVYAKKLTNMTSPFFPFFFVFLFLFFLFFFDMFGLVLLTLIFMFLSWWLFCWFILPIAHLLTSKICQQTHFIIHHVSCLDRFCLNFFSFRLYMLFKPFYSAYIIVHELRLIVVHLFLYQCHANRCILIEIVHCYYVIFVFVMIFPSSTRVETKEISTVFHFHALILWYSCLSRDFMPEYMLHIFFAHFEWTCVCYVHTNTAGVPALYVVQGICIPKVDFMILCNLPIS